ncbi:MAG: T9SS type A sorting domain-containing protein, partial [Ignavibacteria bacterium]|nr:T9SS type A sorting domain-containing protein [Ignavibacteria bacterium]
VGRGPNPTSNEEDLIFGTSKPEFLMMDVVENGNGGYDGTYIIGINSPTGVTETDLNPQGFKLEQNYPNPFNPTTKIKYTIPEEVKVKLGVYSVEGEELEILVNAFQSAGSYQVTFDGSKLSSGIYFYRLTAGSFSKTREMLLIK